MSKYPEKKTTTGSPCYGPKEPLAVSGKAKELHFQLLENLQSLCNVTVNSCCDEAFTVGFNTYLLNFELYQKEVLRGTPFKPSCKSGCSFCCNHWVEDVNSFEAEIIVDYIKKNYSESIQSIITTCERDIAALENVERCIQQHPHFSAGTDDTGIDQIDMLLSVYYQLKRPCPLIDKFGRCMVYPVRPLTCRIYMSFSSPSLCKPEYINECDTPTYLLDVDESAGNLLDLLHFKYIRFEGDCGLRSLLHKHLTDL